MPGNDIPPVSESLQLMAKPIGALCNLRCQYCFYLPKQQLYPTETSWRMSDEVLDSYSRQYLNCLANAPEVVFAWQGGEPTLMGLDFFRRAVRYQHQYARPGQRVSNAFQTNGILLDDEWCRFLHNNSFLVGLSMDGPSDLHDSYRRDPQDHGTHKQVMQTMQRLQRHKVEFNVLCTVHRLNAQHPRNIYRFFKEIGVQFMQFIPIVVPIPGEPGEVSEHSVTPGQWGNFLCEIFDEWVRNDIGQVFVQTFVVALAAWMGLRVPLCVFSEVCGRALIIEHNGDIYSCDHFVTPPHRLGNLLETPLRELVDCEFQERFGNDKNEARPQSCKDCPVNFVCHGGCPKNRITPSGIGEPPINHLCKGYLRFFQHIDPYMKQMVDAVHQRQPAGIVMQQFRKPPTSRRKRSGKR